MQTSRRQQTWPTKWSLNLVNQILAAARTRIQATNVRGGASIGSTCAEGQHDEENARWRYFSASRWSGPRFHMTEAKHEPFRLYLFRSTSPQQIEREKIWKKKQRSLLVPPVHNHSFFMVTKECILWSMVCIVHTKQYLDRRFIIPFCFKQDYSQIVL